MRTRTYLLDGISTDRLEPLAHEIVGAEALNFARDGKLGTGISAPLLQKKCVGCLPMRCMRTTAICLVCGSPGSMIVAGGSYQFQGGLWITSAPVYDQMTVARVESRRGTPLLTNRMRSSSQERRER